jgi:hypothetical protein
MAKIDLSKHEEKVKIVLTKRNLTNIQTQVKLAIDRSGSMDSLYRDGTVQETVQRILAVGMQVDMDKSIDVWAFHNDGIELPAVKENNIDGYVEREIVRKISSGGTSYGPVMAQIVESAAPQTSVAEKAKGLFGGLFSKKEAAPLKPSAADPALAIFITDGENDDPSAAERAIIASQGKDIYWMLIGIGGGHFNFIEQLGDKYPNCGFFKIDDIKHFDDEDLYESILCDECAEWFKKFQK